MIIHFDNICSTTVPLWYLGAPYALLEFRLKLGQKKAKNSIIYENLSTCFCPKNLTFGQSRWCFIWNAQAPPRSSPIRTLISGPLAWSDATRNVAPWTPREKRGKTTNKTGKRKVLVVVYQEYPATLGHQLGSCFLFFFFVFSFSGWVQIYTIVVSFSWKELEVEWTRWRMGKEGWRWWLLGKTSRLPVVFVLSSHLFTCFCWWFPEMLWPKHPEGIQRAISLQSLVSQYANSVGRNASRNGLTCQMKVIIESPEKSSHDVWWILKILCSQTKALLGTSPKIDEILQAILHLLHPDLFKVASDL